MNSLSAEWDARLQQVGCRLTVPRQAVIAILSETQRPLSPLEIYDQARRLYRGLGLVTVYRTLERLESLALIRRVSLPSRGLAYLPNPTEADVILLCRLCGHVEPIREQTLELLLQHLGRKLGYQVAHQTLEISGTCQNCQSKVEW